MVTIVDIPKECSYFVLRRKTTVRLRRFDLHGFVTYRWLKCILLFSRRTQKIICISVGSTETLAGISVPMCLIDRRLGLSATLSTGTQFLPKQVHGLNEQVTSVALGQDHTIVITKSGALYTWGSNQHGQLGYSLDLSINKDNVQRIPRKIVAPLKRIEILGVAASNVHSVCFSKEDLYTWGLNRGQLGYSAGDEGPIQSIPRKVASLPSQVEMVSAIDNATICLLKNKTVMIFANNGYFRVK
jgi:alpha-tubulin suppressor-like RCC1 family protein